MGFHTTLGPVCWYKKQIHTFTCFLAACAIEALNKSSSKVKLVQKITVHLADIVHGRIKKVTRTYLIVKSYTHIISKNIF